MKEATNLDENHDFFSARRQEEVVIINFNKDIMFRVTDLKETGIFFEYLDRVSNSDGVKAVVLVSSPGEKGREEYMEFYNQLFESKLEPFAIHRLYNVFHQFILKIISLNKIVIHANSGSVISLLMNVSLACDYRLIANNTVFQNSYLELGLVPIGGGAFFLQKMLGTGRAYDILLSEKNISANEALTLGIVDKVVPLDKLEEAALNVAHRFGKKSARSLTGVKKLLNYSKKDLNDYLEFEKEELMKILSSLSNLFY